MATTLVDVLSRRTRALLLDRTATAEAAPAVARLLAGELGWSDSRIDAEIAALLQVAAESLPDARVAATAGVRSDPSRPGR